MRQDSATQGPALAGTAPGGALPALVRFSSDPAEVVGKVVDGRYAVEQVLGRGAMAVVLGARHLFLDTPVAIKILHPALVAVSEMRERFLREARVTSGVAHEGLVRVSDFGVTPEGLHYLVMERLEGEDLLSWSEKRGQLGADVCAAIAIGVCDALAALHAAGYVHRDLKPENLWVVPDDGAMRIKVLDLGIAGLIESAGDARVGRHERADVRLTQAGQTLGTALYMSPEQTIGNPLDQRSDLYALGCVLWELATDRCAFEAPTVMDIMLKQVSERPAPPSSLNASLPEWFDRIVLKLLEKKPEDRFQSALEVKAALQAALGTAARPSLAEPPPEAPRAVATVEPGVRWVWPLLALGALAAVVALVLVLVRGSSAEAPSDATPALTGRAVPALGKVTAPAWLAAPRSAPVQEPAAVPAKTKLVFAVEPKGARVTRDGQLVGETPFVLEVPREATRARYAITAEGRVGISVELAHDHDAIVQETLARAYKGERARDGATERPADGLWQPETPAARPDAGP